VDGLLLGIDLGTSAVKAAVVDPENIQVLCSASAPLSLETPRAGWREQAPDDWVQAAKQAICHLPREVRSRIQALSFSGQMHGLVLLNEEGRPLRKAILWCDTRTSVCCRDIEKCIGRDRLLNTVMNPPLEGFTLPKLLWVARHEAELLKKTRHLLLPKDYLRFVMTGNIAMDHSDAAGTLMQNIAEKRWQKDLLEDLELSADILPPLLPATAVVGDLKEGFARETGLAKGLPVVAGGADNACAAIASGVVAPGRVALSLGTSGTLVAPSRTPERDARGRVHTFNHAVDGLYYLMGVHQASGLSLRWWKDICKASSFNSLLQEAASREAASEGLFFAPWLNGERTPYLDGGLRGAFIGLSAHHDEAHLTRALLEGVAFSFRQSADIFRDLKLPLNDCRFVGGGARSPVWSQILADTLKLNLSRLAIEEGPAFGAALIAGVGCGLFRDFEEATGRITVKDVFSARKSESEKMDAAFLDYEKLYRAVKSLEA
jgi:xylulokinase